MIAGRGLLVLAAALTGCHSELHPETAASRPERVVADRTLDDALATVDSLSLQVVAKDFQGPFPDALERIARNRVVFVGETHPRYEHHLVQLAVLRALHQRHPDLALGVEWFQQDVQQPLDDYLAERISEAQMLHQTRYYERWRFDYRLYRPIVEYAKRNGIPILALNAPMELTRQVSEGGLESLSPEDRARLPQQLGTPDAAYRQRVRAAYDMHPNSQQPFERFLSVQLVWDESMADRAARYLAANPDAYLAVFAGSGHVGFRNAIPERLIRRRPVSTLSVETVDAAPKAAPEPGEADLLVVAPDLQLPPSGKLGVMVDTHRDGVSIIGVMPDSGAFHAGIRDGDRIVELDGQPIHHFADLKAALMDKRPADTVAVGAQADGGELRRLDVVLQ